MKKTTSDIIAEQEAALQGEKPKKSPLQLTINIIVDVLLVLALIMAVIATYTSFVTHSGSGVANIFGFSPYSVQTESMYPTFKPGDLIISKTASHEELTKLKTSEYDANGNLVKAGDIITYWTTINGKQVLNTHRIVEIYVGGDDKNPRLIFETKGDGNSIIDSFTVHEAYVVGVYTGIKISGLGKVFDFFQTSTGFLICVVVPILLFFVFNLVQFFRSLFEYQNVKTLIQYEEEREKNEAAETESQNLVMKQAEEERLRMEQELRDRIRAEMLAEMGAPAPAPTAESMEAEPIEAEPVEAEPVEAEPVEAEPIEAEPIEAEPIEAEPVEAEPVEAEPVSTEEEKNENDGGMSEENTTSEE